MPYFPGESINLGMASAEEPVRQGDVELDLMKYWNTAFPPQTRYDLVCCLGSLQFPVTATRMTLQSAGVPGDLAKLGVAMPRARSNQTIVGIEGSLRADTDPLGREGLRPLPLPIAPFKVARYRSTSNPIVRAHSPLTFAATPHAAWRARTSCRDSGFRCVYRRSIFQSLWPVTRETCSIGNPASKRRLLPSCLRS